MEDNLITAIKAKEIADSVINKTHNDEMKNIIGEIIKVAERGEYTYTWYDKIMMQTSNKLVELGFNVESGGRMGETEYNISWK